MARRRPRLYDQVPNRGMAAVETAYYLGLSQGRFAELLAALQAEGFPTADPTTGRYDRRAVDLWLDRRAGLAEPCSDLDQRIADYGRNQGATSRH